jgi:hypothetical protein
MRASMSNITDKERIKELEDALRLLLDYCCENELDKC